VSRTRIMNFARPGNDSTFDVIMDLYFEFAKALFLSISICTAGKDIEVCIHLAFSSERNTLGE